VLIVRDGDPCPELVDGSVVTIGAYDGVHRGHVAVIDQVRSIAAAEGRASAVVTFDRHPASVVRPVSAPRLLTGLDEKLELLEATGVDVALVVAFDELRAKESAEDFVDEVLVGCLDTRVVVVGEDFHFGHARSGNVELLRRIGPGRGFDVRPIELVALPGAEVKVSSTAIRAALAAGDLPSAAAMLGRPHEVRGVVGHGDERARELGYPTANVEVDDERLLPADGIYAGWYVRPDGTRLPAAISLGRRPTFYEDAPVSLLEAHVLDAPAGLDLYGEAARVVFVERLRDELRFESVDDLVAQMALDCDQAASILASVA
jgi:riboflavin kinase/FMN adenylyltransferase